MLRFELRISEHTAVLGSAGNPLVAGKVAIFQWNSGDQRTAREGSHEFHHLER